MVSTNNLWSSSFMQTEDNAVVSKNGAKAESAVLCVGRVITAKHWTHVFELL